MNQNKKILLISVSTGAGHTRAAQAIQKTAKLKFFNLEVEHIDMMDYVKTPMKKAVVRSYDIMAKQLPEVWRFFYKKTNNPQVVKYARELTKISNRMNARRFFIYLASFNPDYILCTHFLPAISLCAAPQKEKNNIPFGLLMTDYDNHGLQICSGISQYFVSTEKVRSKLIYNGLPSEQIIESGIPIDPVFYEEKNISLLKEKYQIPLEQKTILILSGGQGLASIDEITSVIFKLKIKLNIIAISGTNQKLKKKLEKLTTPENINLQVIGWTDKIDEYMRLADIIITKPGGLSTTECIALQKPIIAISPIPGQEEHNAEYLLENGFGVVARAPGDLLYYLQKNPSKLALGIDKQTKKQPAAEIILKQINEILHI